ncbi:MAG: hypothetical protein QOF46_2089 [Paraburkholderia sp.]|nr:hypothetical protein [Paraburkholderia sp.]
MEARSSRPSPVERASSSDRVVWARYIVRNRNILLRRRQARRGEFIRAVFSRARFLARKTGRLEGFILERTDWN